MKKLGRTFRRETIGQIKTKAVKAASILELGHGYLILAVDSGSGSVVPIAGADSEAKAKYIRRQLRRFFKRTVLAAPRLQIQKVS